MNVYKSVLLLIDFKCSPKKVVKKIPEIVLKYNCHWFEKFLALSFSFFLLKQIPKEKCDQIPKEKCTDVPIQVPKQVKRILKNKNFKK